jgi:predicted ATPase
MITSVAIDNFKNIRHQRIGLEPLTVFVGPNGSGKTSVLEAIDLAGRAATGKPTSVIGSDGNYDPLESILAGLRSLSEKVFVSERHCDWLYTRGGHGNLSIKCATREGTFSVVASPPLDYPSPTVPPGKGKWEFYPGGSGGDLLDEVLREASSIVYLRFDAGQLAKPSYSERDVPRVEFGGRGLASVLAYLALNKPDAFDGLTSHMRELIPQLVRIRFRKVPIRRMEQELIRVGDESIKRRTSRVYRGEAIVFDFKNAENVSAQTASEGTLILLGLMAVLLGPNQPRILLMDDIDHGLHPRAQKSLLAVLGQVMQKFPDLQIVATAHSPYLLDQLQPEQIRLMTVGADGYSVCGRLEDHPQFAKWKDEMAPGELWSLFGEKWLVGGGVAK